MTKQVMEVMHLRFERAHLAHLLSCQNAMDGEAGHDDQRTITQSLRQETKPAPLGESSDSDAGAGSSSDKQQEHQHILVPLDGPSAQTTRKIARKVTSPPAACPRMNEKRMIL